MSLNAAQLDAFVAVAKTRHFSRAASEVHVTQSALSQRIQGLERELGQSLFVRGAKDVRLTDAGAKLLRYCRIKDALEAEALAELDAGRGAELAGRLRVAGFSTVMRSVVIPALAPLLRRHPRLLFEFAVRETRELPGMLLHGEAEFVILDRALGRADVESRPLGRELNVLIEPRARSSRPDTFLDHDLEDRTTEDFFRRQPRPTRVARRCYMDDIDGILEGVRLGLGRAVVPRHLLGPGLPVRVARGFRGLESPVVLHYMRQSHYSKLHRAAVEALTERAPALLARGQ